MYLAHSDLIERPGARELAQVASDEHEPMVPHELMALTLLDANRDGWSAAEIERADKALARIDDAVTRASEMIDGFLVRRYAVPLPDSPEPVPGLVKEWCRQIARFFLHQHLDGDEKSNAVVRGYRDAVKMLQQVADGKLFLGYNDPVATDAGNVDVQFDSDTNVFGRKELDKFR